MLREAVAARRGSEVHGHVSRAVIRESSRGLRFPRGFGRVDQDARKFHRDALARPEVLGGPFGVLFLIVWKHVTGLFADSPHTAAPRTEGMSI